MSFLDNFKGNKFKQQAEQLAKERDQFAEQNIVVGKELEELKSQFQSLKASIDLMPAEIESGENYADPTWFKRSIVDPNMILRGAGFGLVAEPYSAYIQMKWGMDHPPDYQKFKKMEIRVPHIHRAAEEMVNLALQKDFTFKYTDEKMARIFEILGTVKNKSER